MTDETDETKAAERRVIEAYAERVDAWLWAQVMNKVSFDGYIWRTPISTEIVEVKVLSKFHEYDPVWCMTMGQLEWFRSWAMKLHSHATLLIGVKGTREIYALDVNRCVFTVEDRPYYRKGQKTDEVRPAVFAEKHWFERIQKA